MCCPLERPVINTGMSGSQMIAHILPTFIPALHIWSLAKKCCRRFDVVDVALQDHEDFFTTHEQDLAVNAFKKNPASKSNLGLFNII